MRRFAPPAFLIFVAVVYLAGNGTVGLWDRDEPRYAQASRQMLQSGDWVVPRFLDTVRTAKPVFIYWCQASAMAVVGDNAFAARLPSTLAMLVTLGLVGWFVAKAAGPRRAGWTVVVMASSILVIASAKMCMTDSVLLLWITMTQLGLYVMWRGGATWTICVVFGVSAGCAGLTKGPVALGVNAMTLVGLGVLRALDVVLKNRAARRVRLREVPVVTRAEWKTVILDASSGATHVSTVKIFTIVALIAFVTFPWMYLVEQRAPGFLMTSINKDVIERSRQGAEGHSGPPGYYLLTVWGTFFPWSLLLPAALVMAWKNRRLPLVRFSLAAAVGPWLMFEIVKTKLPHYLLPLFPFLAIMVADLLVRAGRGTTTMLRDRAASVCGVGFGIVVAVGGLVPWGLALHFQLRGIAPALTSTLIAGFSIAAGVFIATNFVRRRPLTAAAGMALGTLLAVLLIYAFWLPQATFLRLSQHLAADLQRAGATSGYMIDYKEPSLAFHQGGGLLEQPDGEYLTHTPRADWCRWLVMPRERWEQQPLDIQAGWQIIGSRTGLVLNGGKIKEILVLQNRLSR